MKSYRQSLDTASRQTLTSALSGIPFVPGWKRWDQTLIMLTRYLRQNGYYHFTCLCCC